MAIPFLNSMSSNCLLGYLKDILIDPLGDKELSFEEVRATRYRLKESAVLCSLNGPHQAILNQSGLVLQSPQNPFTENDSVQKWLPLKHKQKESTLVKRFSELSKDGLDGISFFRIG